MKLLQQPAAIGTTQRRFALWLSVLLVVAGIGMTPFANQPWLPVPGYMTAFGAAMLAVNFMLAMLLYNRGATEGDGFVVMLGTAYFFVAVIFVPLMASFPNGLIAGSILGTSVTSVWLWSFWHAGFGLLILRYVRATQRKHRRPRSSLRESIVTVLVVVLLSVIATAGLPNLPSLFVDGHSFFSGGARIVPWTILLMDTVAVIKLARIRHKTPEQLWLTVGMLAACFDVWLTFHGTERFSLGWYVSKMGSLFTSMAVLISLFSELAMLYRRAAENAYFLTTITDNIPALIGYIDHDEIFRYSNRAYDRMLGVDHRDMLGKSMREILGEPSYLRVKPYVDRVLGGERQRFEREAIETGRPIHFMCEYIPDIAPDGSVRGFHAMVMDISDRKNAELSQARSEQLAEAANRAKSEFVANMSHEIRTPMNAVLGVTQLLARTRLSGEQSRYLSMIRHSGTALLTIINDILDFSKIEAGKLDIVTAPFQLNEVISAVAAVMSVNVGLKKIELAIGVAPDVPHTLSGDAMRLQQALINLVSNALKFTESGAVVLCVSVDASQAGRVVLRFEVRDTGIGMSQEQLARLFAPFEQADSTTSRRFGGTGLGLIISRRLIELMGGRIDVLSNPGQGSRFSIVVPFAVVATRSEEQPAPVLNLVLIEPGADTRTCLANTVQGLGWSLQAASEPQGALALCTTDQAGAARSDLILFDQATRALPGFAQLQSYAKQHAITMIMMCNACLADPNDGQDIADEVLLKPVTAPALLELARRIVGERDEHRASGSVDLDATPNINLLGTNILLVDDNATNLMVAQGMLEPLGVTLETAENGAVAVARLRAAPTLFDLVLMDIQMPVMDGFAAARIIRNELGLTVPILAMTAGVLESERSECLAAGMNDVIAKPLDFEVATAQISHQLRVAG